MSDSKKPGRPRKKVAMSEKTESQIVELYFHKGLRCREIAKLLGYSERTIFNHIQKIRKQNKRLRKNIIESDILRVNDLIAIAVEKIQSDGETLKEYKQHVNQEDGNFLEKNHNATKAMFRGQLGKGNFTGNGLSSKNTRLVCPQ